jgi:hypothetical protein
MLTARPAIQTRIDLLFTMSEILHAHR